MLFEKQNAALEGFNQWTINGVSYPPDQMMATPAFHLRQGKRYRIGCETQAMTFIPSICIATALN
jgi:hypothetical protein